MTACDILSYPGSRKPRPLAVDECFWPACPELSGGCRPAWALVRCYGLCPWGSTGEVMSMRLYLVQHGEAKSEAEDPERSLTIRGEEETRRISDAAKRLGIRPSRIYHSGKKRAEQTAGIMAGAFDLSAQLGQGLNPNDDVRPWVERVSREAEDLMIVGHLPFLEKLASFLVCGDEGAKAVVFRYSAIVCLEKKESGRWAVDWVIKPEMV